MVIVFFLTLLVSCVTSCMEKSLLGFFSNKGNLSVYQIGVPRPPTHIASSSSGNIVACLDDTNVITCINDISSGKKHIRGVPLKFKDSDLETFGFYDERLVVVDSRNAERQWFILSDMNNVFLDKSGGNGSFKVFPQNRKIGGPKAHVLSQAHKGRIVFLPDYVRKATWSPLQHDLFLVVFQDDTLAERSYNTLNTGNIISYHVQDADYNVDGTKIFALMCSNDLVIFDALLKNQLKKIPCNDTLQSMNILHGIGIKNVFLVGITNVFALVDTEQEDESEAVKKETINTWSSITTSHFNRNANLIALAGINQDGNSEMIIIR